MAFDSPQKVLNFWFAEDMGLFNDAAFTEAKMKQWYVKATGDSADVQHANKGLVELAGTKQLVDDIWFCHDGKLAQIILLDQFTREIYRGTPQAFQYDEVAENLTWQIIDANQLMSYHPIQRSFILSPLLHAENIRSQLKGVELAPTIGRDASDGLKDYMNFLPQFYNEHCEVIRRFGRFPSRNAVLHRQNTPEEEEYLASPDLPGWAKSQLPK